MRDDFAKPVIDALARRVGFRCSNPRCQRPTSGPQVGGAGTVSTGVAAHITAASPGGARYDASLSAAERSSQGNGVWLCAVCAKLIDSDPVRYSRELLHAWRSDAEEAAAIALTERHHLISTSEGVCYEAERLMPDLIREMRADVQGDGTELVRQFWVIPSRGVVINTRQPAFLYDQDRHPQVYMAVEWLAEMSLVSLEQADPTVPRYRLSPEFHRWLRETEDPLRPDHDHVDVLGTSESGPD